MKNLFKKWFGSSKEIPEQIEDTGHVQPTDCHDDGVVKKKDEKLEQLSKMMDEMEKENKEKFFKEGNQQAGQRLADLAYFREKMESSCKHEWVSDGCGRLYCSKCGEDGGSPWDC